MFSNLTRITLIAVCVAGGIYLGIRGDWRAVFFIVPAILWTYGYFRYGTVWAAFQALRKGDRSRAEELISQVNRPELLSPQQRAYYEMIKGSIKAQDKQWEDAEKHFQEALRHRVRTENDRNVIELSLAEIAIERGRNESAAQLLEGIRGRSFKPELESLIQRLEDRLKATS